MAKKQIVVRNVVGSYVNVFKARPPPNAKDGAENLYSIVLLFDKKDPQLAAIQEQVIEVAESRWPGKAKDVLRKAQYAVLRDGDDGDAQEQKGKVYMVAKRRESFGPPDVVDRKRRVIVDQKAVYSGAKYNAQVTLYAYEQPTGRGVAVGLDALQFVEDGPRLDGRMAIDDAFGELDGDEETGSSLF